MIEQAMRRVLQAGRLLRGTESPPRRGGSAHRGLDSDVAGSDAAARERAHAMLLLAARGIDPSPFGRSWSRGGDHGRTTR